MVTRTSKTTATRRSAAPAAKKSAPAPAKKAAPAKPAPTRKAAAPKAAPAPKPAVKSVEAVTAHDVLRARKAVEAATQEAYRLENLYWAQNSAALDEAKAHAEKAAAELAPPKKAGPKPADTPARRARAKDPVAGEFYDRDKVENYSLRELRDLAEDLADREIITERKMKRVILEQMEDAGLFREEGHSSADEDDELPDDEDAQEDEEAEDFEEDEDESSDEDDAEDDEDDADDAEDGDGDDEEGYTLEELKAMKLKDLQDLAEQNGVEWDDLSKSELIDKLVGEDEDEEDSEDEPEEDDDEEDGDFVEVNPEDIPNMSVKELLELAGDIGLKIPASKRKDKDYLIDKILEQVDDEDE